MKILLVGCLSGDMPANSNPLYGPVGTSQAACRICQCCGGTQQAQLGDIFEEEESQLS